MSYLEKGTMFLVIAVLLLGIMLSAGPCSDKELIASLLIMISIFISLLIALYFFAVHFYKKHIAKKV